MQSSDSHTAAEALNLNPFQYPFQFETSLWLKWLAMSIPSDVELKGIHLKRPLWYVRSTGQHLNDLFPYLVLSYQLVETGWLTCTATALLVVFPEVF